MNQTRVFFYKKEASFKRDIYFLVTAFLLFILGLSVYSLRTNVDECTTNEYLIHILINFLFVLLGGILPQLIYSSIKLIKKKISVTEFFKSFITSSSLLSSLVLLLLLPVGVKFYQVFVTMFIASLLRLLFKKVFFLDSAILARILMQVFFFSDMRSYIGVAGPIDTIISFGNLFPISLSDGGYQVVSELPFWDMFIGNYYYSLASTFFYAILAIYIFLAFSKNVSFTSSLSFAFSIFIAYLLLFLKNGYGLVSFESALRYYMCGDLALVTIYSLSDSKLLPYCKESKILYGLTSSFITLILRLMTHLPSCSAYGILISNILYNNLEYLLPKKIRKVIFYSLIALFSLGILLLVLIYPVKIS